jgi:hypothetical protein
MVARSTSTEYNPSRAPNIRQLSPQPTQRDSMLIKINPPPHRIHNRLWLLENLLLHEMREISHLDLSEFLLKGD